ncbi:hypothetical protein KIN20_026687 [Parelaphostrongylus tenuis]|uniref:EF-hand domain-containing protein n=1 Tax=Parelaphostrongylus tenuis TaxID=148309 RepID=A0AAD5QYC0_PARTN|nr:hypothetical protein KIN20_026687 [Parelaphostrongylus tenuis]
MQLVLFTALCYGAFSAPLSPPLEEQFNMPGFSALQENYEEKFLRVDQNRDKKLTFDEFLQMEVAYVDAKKEEFDSLDKNGDGVITHSEYEEHYRGVSNRSEARRTEYFGKVFREFDENRDMSLGQDELEKVLAKRFLVKPRENFPKLFYNLDKDHSGGLDLNEYMKFDATFPFEQTDPIIYGVNAAKSNEQVFSISSVPNSNVDEKDAEAIAQVMGLASPSFKKSVPSQMTISQKRPLTSSFDRGVIAKNDFGLPLIKRCNSNQMHHSEKLSKSRKTDFLETSAC